MKFIIVSILGVFLLAACGKNNDSQPSAQDNLKVRLTSFDQQTFYRSNNTDCKATVGSNKDSSIVSVSVGSSNYCGDFYRLTMAFICDTTMICKMANTPSTSQIVYGLVLINDNAFSISRSDGTKTQESIFTK